MATKNPPPKRYGTSGQAGTPRSSKSNAGQAKPMPKKRVAYRTPSSSGNALGGRHGRGKGAPTSATQVHR